MTNIIYPISEIFESVQGEGNFTGVNALFLRFQLCNLKCSWCDTKYTWKLNSGEKAYTGDELRGFIRDARQHHIIFTGGEPTLYRLDLLAVPGKKYHVESNGTIIPEFPLKIELPDRTVIERDGMDHEIIKNFNWVISPKLSNSGQIVETEELLYWSKQNQAFFKFVIQNLSDLEEMEAWVKEYQLSPRKSLCRY